MVGGTNIHDKCTWANEFVFCVIYKGGRTVIIEIKMNKNYATTNRSCGHHKECTCDKKKQQQQNRLTATATKQVQHKIIYENEVKSSVDHTLEFLAKMSFYEQFTH